MVPTRDRLRILREKRGINQQEAAQLLGMPPATYSSYENGVNPKLDVLVSLATFYDATTDYLLGLSNERQPASGALTDGLKRLTQFAGEDAITATELAALLEAAAKYYRVGAPCGSVPMKAMRGFVEGLRAALAATAVGDGPAAVEGANAAVVSALEVTKMPAMLCEAQKNEK